MCIRDSSYISKTTKVKRKIVKPTRGGKVGLGGYVFNDQNGICLLYTSDAADERSSVDLGGRRIIKKKKRNRYTRKRTMQDKKIHLADKTRQ